MGFVCVLVDKTKTTFKNFTTKANYGSPGAPRYTKGQIPWLLPTFVCLAFGLRVTFFAFVLKF
jgi:hypothetical protein